MFIFQVKLYEKDISIKFINGSQSVINKKKYVYKIKENISTVYIFLQLITCTMIQNIKMNKIKTFMDQYLHVYVSLY